jgi:Protein kinase domain
MATTSTKQQDEQRQGRYLATAFTSFLFVLFIEWRWPQLIPFSLFQFWFFRGTVVGVLSQSWPLFVWGIGLCTFVLLLGKKPSSSVSPEKRLVAGAGMSVVSGIGEELTYRYAVFYAQIVGYSILGWVLFEGWAGFNLPRWFFLSISGPVVDFLTLGHLHSLLFAPGLGWAVGAAILSSNGKWRDEHVYHGTIGRLNVWLIGMYLFFLLFHYGLFAAMLVRFGYDISIEMVIYLFACMERSRGVGAAPIPLDQEAGTLQGGLLKSGITREEKPAGVTGLLPVPPPPAALAPALPLPSTLLNGRYRLLERIGQGGMGAIYRAEDVRFNHRIVAVKEMNQHGLLASDKQAATAAFQREADLLAMLMHPHLPRIYDHFDEGGNSYLVMDYIEGETLEAYLGGLSGKPLPVEAACEVVLQLCEALSYLHSQRPPVIFRDLKPANVMRTPGGYLYLIDFGIARLFKPGQPTDTIALGSPGYAAPEQYGREQTTQRSDIYSLGALLHQLLTGRDPSASPFTFDPLAGADAPTLRLNGLVQRMVQMKPGDRPSTIQEVQREVNSVLILFK